MTATVLKALERKSLREVAALKGQVATIAIVLGCGITCFIALRGNCDSLAAARDAYYDRYRFAHVFARVERAPETLARKIERLPGVAVLQTRIAKEVTVPLEGMPRPAYARMLSLPPSGVPATNALALRSGRWPARSGQDEVVVLQSFADAHGLEPGHRLPAVVNGKLRRLRIVGTALSPEFVYTVRPGAMVDDPQRYAVLWMTRSALAAAFQLEGAFNDVSLRLQPGASEREVLAALDRILAPFGGNGAIGRDAQLSNRILNGELGQLEALAGMVPLVFLGVAAFLVNLVLSRLIALQRQEIAMLKAIGYTNLEIGRHYLLLIAVVMVPGALLGIAGGYGLGYLLIGVYGRVFRFPQLAFTLSPALLVSGLAVSFGAAALGGTLAARSAMRLPPAQAMRPPTPVHYGRGLLERLGLAALLGPTGMMVVREIERRPLRTALSAFGVAGAVALLVLGRFATDSMDEYLEGTVLREQRQDLAVAFVRPLSPRVVGQLARTPGVTAAEGLRVIPVRVRLGHRMRESALIGLPANGTLRRLIENGGQDRSPPADGVLVSKTLGDVLEFGAGERLELELREGERRTVSVTVAGFVSDSVGMFLYARSEVLARLERDSGAISSVLMRVDPTRLAGVEAALRRSPHAVDISELRADTQRSSDMHNSLIDVWTAVSITLAACVIFGLVYNDARIAIAMRSRDLASLRVLGFFRREISTILIAGLAFEVALAIPLGLWLGRRWGALFMRTVDQETFRFTVVVAPKTYLLCTLVAVLAAAASALWVRRSLDRLDLIAVLKTRE